MKSILVLGGGPAGAAAAIAAASEGSSVRLLERSRQPRHKVCGEFLSPGICAALHHLGAADIVAGAAVIRRCRLCFGLREKSWTLAEPARGLSRFEFDHRLLERAATYGAVIERGATAPHDLPPGAAIFALGRRPQSNRGDRLFGFKAHFEGPPGDAIELFFGPQGYIGINTIENGWTNVCGMAPEAVLRRYDFEIDPYVAAFPALAERLRPLCRRMPWLMVGPLCLTPVSGGPAPGDCLYPAGDALGFTDPFTGTGILNALLTGRLAGINAARSVPVSQHIRQCRDLLGRPFGVSAMFRKVLQWDCAWQLAALTPGPWLFWVTRAHLPQ